MFHLWARTVAVPLHAGRRKQQGMKLKGGSAAEPHRAAQDLGCEKETERERLHEQSGSKRST